MNFIALNAKKRISFSFKNRVAGPWPLISCEKFEKIYESFKLNLFRLSAFLLNLYFAHG